MMLRCCLPLVHTLMIAIALFSNGVVFVGCQGSKSKYVTAVNGPSQMELRARYVTVSKRVRVRRTGDESILVIDFGLPDTMPRVSNTKILQSIKRYDFLNIFGSTHDDILKGIPTDNKCTVGNWTFSTAGPDKLVTSVTVDQSTEGVLNVNIYNKETNDFLMQAALYQPKGTSDQDRKCIQEGTSQPDFKLVTSLLLIVRSGFMLDLAKDAGFNVDHIGTRLSRKQPDDNAGEQGLIAQNNQLAPK